MDGAAVARTIRAEVAAHVAALRDRGVVPGLAVVLVGDDPASAVYVRMKGRACEEAGMHSTTFRLPASTPEAELLARVDALNADRTVHGVLVQMPLPPQIAPRVIMRRIRPDKDVDGFHPVNVGKLHSGETDGFVPATPLGILELLLRCGIETEGRECVVVGRSNIVGRPMAALLLRNAPGGNATVTVCHSHTRWLAAHTRSADILIVAAGRPGMITGEMIRPGAVVVDVGVNRVPDAGAPSGYRLVGDVDFESARAAASRITPVPGGVGPMTIALLLRNTLDAARAVSA